MITSIRLQNFKGHRDTVVPLGRFTVLVGPNGAGKTSVLQALELLSKLVNEEPTHVLRGDLSPQDLHRRGTDKPTALAVGGVSPDEYMAQDVPWGLSVAWPVEFQGEKVRMAVTSVWGLEEHKVPPVTGSLGAIFSEMAHEQIPQAIGSSVLYRFDASEIAAVSFSAEENPVVEHDGGNTAVVLAAMKLERAETFAQIETELRRIVPNLLRIRIRRVKRARGPAEAEAQVGNKIFLDFKGAADVPANAASEGTLVTLALLTALCSPTRPKVLLLDDIDQSMHPQAQAQLMKELKRLLEGFPEVQIVATTHSPYILDELDPSDVMVFAPREDGGVACRRLSEHPQAAQMKGSLSGGQLWTLDPESRWVVGEG
jgi:predicted ATPase